MSGETCTGGTILASAGDAGSGGEGTGRRQEAGATPQRLLGTGAVATSVSCVTSGRGGARRGHVLYPRPSETGRASASAHAHSEARPRADAVSVWSRVLPSPLLLPGEP